MDDIDKTCDSGYCERPLKGDFDCYYLGSSRE